MNCKSNIVVYLDNNASTPPLVEVKEAMLQAMGPEFSNPSSAHSLGGMGEQLLARARQNLADLLGGASSVIYITGSGTEANNWAIRSAFPFRSRGRRFITTPIEHSSVLKQAAYLADVEGIDVVYVPVHSSPLGPDACQGERI